MKNNNEQQMYQACFIMIALSLAGVLFLSHTSYHLTGITGNVILEENIDKSSSLQLSKRNSLNQTFGIVLNNITREQALHALLQGEADLEQMINDNFSVLLIKDTLLLAKRSFIGVNISGQSPALKFIKLIIQQEKDSAQKKYFESLLQTAEKTPVYELRQLNYPDVLRLTQQISLKKNQAYKLRDMLSLIDDKEKSYAVDSINTSEALPLIAEAKKAFAEERYDDAEAKIDSADILLDKASTEHTRVAELLLFSKNFFQRNWLKLIAILIILLILFYPLIKIIRNKYAQHKLDRLRAEVESLSVLMKKTQQEYFISKHISETTYHLRMEQYWRRLARIKHAIPVLEAIIADPKDTNAISRKKQEQQGALEVKIPK